MTSPLLLLDGVPPDAGPGNVDDWFSDIAASLANSPQQWLTAIDRTGQLSDEHAWSLLSWIETAASQVVRVRSQDALATCAFAMSLVLHSALDRRDCAIVASLLRRASERAGLDFAAGVTEGCEQAETTGQEAADLLLHASPTLPSTHLEAGFGETFCFTRVEPGFDVHDLERWLEGGGP